MTHPDEIKTIGVVGAGQMGSGIAQVAAGCGVDVVLVDSTSDLAQKGRKRIEGILSRLIDKGKMAPDARDVLLAHIRCGSGLDALGSCDLAIEAATENVELKVDLVRRCDAVIAPG